MSKEVFSPDWGDEIEQAIIRYIQSLSQIAKDAAEVARLYPCDAHLEEAKASADDEIAAIFWAYSQDLDD